MVPLASAEFLDDRIEVTEQAPHYQRSVSKVLPEQKAIDETSFSADSLATLLEQSPLVNLNGQGGLFQTVNIRGFARWRIQTLVEGVPIYTERRAGTAVEFIPPAFISQAYITQGAASTQLGSGAIGGGIDLILATPQQHALTYSYGHLADYREVQVQGNVADEGLSYLLNHRHANNSQDAKGDAILDRFEQQSIALRKRMDTGKLREGLLLYSSANNIAKASSDAPAKRITLYPANDHLLGKVQFDWLNTTFYLHDSKQLTLVDRPGKRVNRVSNDALDLGLQLNDELKYGQTLLSWRAGIDARTGVKVFEREVDSAGDETFARLNLDAQQWQAFVASEFVREAGQGTWVGGARLAQQYQHDNLFSHTSEDTNLSGFIGYAHTLNANWQWAGYLSHAYRVPSLTERYYDGTTPRGTVKGSVDLTTETAINAQTSLIYQSKAVGLSITLFEQNINDYIERVNQADDQFVYRNIASARVRGLSYQGGIEFNLSQLHWNLDVSGQWLEGVNPQGQRIADIPPAKHRLALTAFGERSQGFIALTHRQSSDELAEGELQLADATTIDAGYHYQLSDSLEISVNLTNLTNRQYVTARDDLAPFAKGRDLHLSVDYLF
ncbi:hypothetical protein GCM10027098_36360 [Bowmanella dokdonensis]